MKNEKKTEGQVRSPGHRLDQDEIRDGQKHFDQSLAKPEHEGINNTDVPGVPRDHKALNNPKHEDEGLSGYSGDSPLA